jgi:hypothetical protein
MTHSAHRTRAGAYLQASLADERNVIRVIPRGRWVQTLTPMEQHLEYDEERLDLLHSIRDRFIDMAEAGDESAMAILRAVDGMITEVEEWLRLR